MASMDLERFESGLEKDTQLSVDESDRAIQEKWLFFVQSEDEFDFPNGSA